MTFFKVQDLRLWDSSKKIYKFIENLNSTENFNQIISLGFEGGHPDHDSLALILNKFSYANVILFTCLHITQGKQFYPWCF